MLEIEVKYKGVPLKEVRQNVTERMMEAVKSLSVYVWKQAIDYAPRRTGTLKRSITVSNPMLGAEGLTAIIRAGAGIKYAPYVEFGTRPHEIRPRRAKVLHWISEGEHVFARRVRHPGTRGQFFMRRAFEDGEKKASEIFNKFLSIAIGEE